MAAAILSALPLRIFCMGFLAIQFLNIFEWVTQIGTTLSGSYFVISIIATFIKLDAGLCGLLMGAFYRQRDLKQRKIPSFIKTTALIMIYVAGAFSVTTLFVTLHEMNTKAFGVVWIVLLAMVGQTILEMICFIFVIVFANRLFTEYNGVFDITEEKSFEETPYDPLNLTQ